MLSNCLQTFANYNEKYTYVSTHVADRTLYDLGRQEKGNGEPTLSGYYMELTTMYADVVVIATNMYIDCDIDYLMQKIGKSLTSLSGFLDLLTNFLFRFFGSDDQDLYIGLSTAIDESDIPTVGLRMGQFIKKFFVTEIPSVTTAIPTQRYETVRID